MNLFFALFVVLCFGMVVVLQYLAAAMLNTKGYFSQDQQNSVRLLNMISWLLIIIGAASLLLIWI